MLRRHAAIVQRAWVCAGLAWAVSTAGAETAGDLYEGGRAAFSRGSYAVAEESFSALLRQFPDHSLSDDAEYLLGVACAQDGQYLRVLDHLLPFSRKYPLSPYLRYLGYWTGLAQYQLGRHGEALESFKGQIEEYPEERAYRVFSLHYTAMIRQAAGNADAASRDFAEIVEVGLGGEIEEYALYNLGLYYLDRGEQVRIIGPFSRLVSQYPDSLYYHDALYQLAEAYCALGENGEARRRWSALVESGAPEGMQEVAYFRLYELAWAEGDTDGALSAIEVLQRQFPGSSFSGEIAAAKGVLELERGNAEAALRAFERALTLVDSAAEGQRVAYNLGLARTALGLRASAIEAFILAAEGPGGEITQESMFKAAVLLNELGRTADAADMLADVLALAPYEGLREERLRFLGELYTEGGDAPRAGSIWMQLVDEFPGSDSYERYLFRLAGSLLAEGDLEGAIGRFAELAALGSFYAMEARYSLGYIYSVNGEYVRSVEHFDAVVAGTMDAELRSRALLAKGIALYNVEDYVAAGIVFGRYVAESPEGLERGEGLLYLGRAQYRLGHLAAAAESFSAAAGDLDGEDAASALFWLGLSEYRLERYASAAESFAAFASRFPEHERVMEAHYRGGLSLAAEGHHRDALAVFAEALARPDVERSPDMQRQLLYESGMSSLTLGDRAGARRYFDVLGMSASSRGLAERGYYKIAETAYLEGEYAEALEGFDDVVARFGEGTLAGDAAFFAAAAARVLGREDAVLRGWDYLIRWPDGMRVQQASRLVGEGVAGLERGTLERLYSDMQSGPEIPGALAAELGLAYAESLAEVDAARARAVADEVDTRELDDRGAARLAYLRGVLARASGEPARALELLSPIAESRGDRIGAQALFVVAEILAAQGKAEQALSEHLRLTVAFSGEEDLVRSSMERAVELFVLTGQEDSAAAMRQKLRERYADQGSPGD